MSMRQQHDEERLTGLPEEPRPHGLPEDWDYDPQYDWINQRQLAELLNVAPETASRWASKGELSIFAHGMIRAGRHKYSWQVVREYQRIRIQLARRRMRSALDPEALPTAQRQADEHAFDSGGPWSSRLEGVD